MEKYRFNVHLLGNAGVGKDSLVERFERNYFRGYEKPPSRLGAQIHLKSVIVDEFEVELQLWPNHYTTMSSYQSAYFLRRASFFAHGMILVYDITEVKSLHDLEGWLDLCREKVEELHTQIVLAGCKVDLHEQRSVAKEEAEKFARKLGLQTDDVIECSAKTGENVEELFMVLATKLLNQFK